MFHITGNAKARDIIATISLEDYINSMKNPDFTRKSQVDFARTLDRKSDKYKQIKTSLPCIVFNYRHDKIINKESRINTSGYYYIDIDNIDYLDLSGFDFVVSYWKSLSGKGYGVLCRVDGVTLNNYKGVAEQLSKELKIDYDSAAVSADRLCVLGYDKDIYYNKNYKVYNYINQINVKGDIQYTNNKLNTKVGLDVPFSPSQKIKTSNLDELIKEVDFNGEVFIDLKENILEYAQVIVPKVIPNGKRNSIMFPIVSQIYGLNSWMNYNHLFSFANAINEDRFHPVLDFSEMTEIVSKVFSKDAVINNNMKRRFLFNPDYNLSGDQRRSIAVTEKNKLAGQKTLSELFNIINEWDYDNFGKITQVKLAEIIKMNVRTIKRYYSHFKENIKILNSEYKNLDIK